MFDLRPSVLKVVIVISWDRVLWVSGPVLKNTALCQPGRHVMVLGQIFLQSNCQLYHLLLTAYSYVLRLALCLPL